VRPSLSPGAGGEHPGDDHGEEGGDTGAAPGNRHGGTQTAQTRSGGDRGGAVTEPQSGPLAPTGRELPEPHC
jgi:hypothetical protein